MHGRRVHRYELFDEKPVTGWEKAVYYFANQTSKVWFIEDDVYFYDELTLTEIVKKYPESNLLTNRCFIKGEEEWVHWQETTIKLEEPHFKAMVCACRLSKTLLELIKTYAQKHKSLFFLEALFPTLAKQNNLLYDTPPEFEPVKYNDPIKKTDKTRLYHPVKDMVKQQKFRCADTANR